LEDAGPLPIWDGAWITLLIFFSPTCVTMLNSVIGQTICIGVPRL